MNRVSVSITNFGIQWDDRFVASSIPKALQEQIDEAEAALEVSTPGNYPESEHWLDDCKLCYQRFDGGSRHRRAVQSERSSV